jgi:hypothetical protein
MENNNNKRSNRFNSKLAISAMIILITIVSSFNILDKPSEVYVDSAIVKSGLAFATARTLNATVSVFQTSTITVQAIGGASMTVGEFLDPFNDLIEQYATIMKLSIGSLIIQKVVLEIVSADVFKVCLGLSGICLLLSIHSKGDQYRRLLSKIFLFLVFLRFTFVFVVLVNSLVSNAFLDDRTAEDVAIVSAVSEEAEEGQASDILTAQENELLTNELVSLRRENQDLTESMEEFDAPIRRAEEQVQSAEDNVADFRAGVSLTDSLLGNNEELEEARAELEEEEEVLESLISEQQELEYQLYSVIESITRRENTLAGRPNSIMERVGDGFSNLTASFSALQLKLKLDGIITNIIRLMSLFLLETMILPLFFLFLFSKGMKAIWGIEFEGFISPSANAK